MTIDRSPRDALTQGSFGADVKASQSLKENCKCLLKPGSGLLTDEAAECRCAAQTSAGPQVMEGNRWELSCTTIPETVRCCSCGEVCICHQEFERNYV